MTTPVQAQLDEFGRRLEALELAFAQQQWSAGKPRTAPRPFPAPPATPPVPPRAQVPAKPPREPRFELPDIELADLLGARALAIAGGVVTLLGIVFCFILAVDRGWLGPTGRVAIGGAAAAAVFAAGFELRRRFGATHAALAAVGAGIAGGYATLLAATGLYHLLRDSAGLGLAALIAACGLATALAWRSQIVASLGLIGALLAPASLAAQGGITPLGTAFAAFVLGATAAVAIRMNWTRLLVAGVVASAPQIAALVLHAQYRGQAPAGVVALAAAFALVYLAASIAHALGRADREPGRLATSLSFGAGTLAAGAAYRLFPSAQQQGLALLAVALVFGALAAAFFVRNAGRELGALLASVAFTVGALAFGGLLSGEPLAYAWAAEAAVLAWLARRTREIRFQVWSTAYAGLALAHLLAYDPPIRDLARGAENRSGGASAALALAAALVAVARFTGPWAADVDRPGWPSALDRLVATRQRFLRGAAGWLAAVLSTYAISLYTLGTSYEWGGVAVVAIWSSVGLAALLAGIRTGRRGLRLGGVVWIASATLAVNVFGFELDSTPHAWAVLALAAALLAGALAHDLRSDRLRALDPVAGVWAALGAILFVLPLHVLLHGTWNGVDRLGAGILGIALLYAGLAAVLFHRARERGLTTLLWATGALLAAIAAALLLSGTFLVVAWAALAAALAWVAVRTGERRFLAGAAGYLGFAVAHVVTLDAPPAHLFSQQADRGGAAAVLAAAAAAGALAATRRRAGAGPWAWWIAGVLAVYGVSIAILDVSGKMFPGETEEAAFRSGHTAVSAFWGLLALGLLYAGLKRWRSLRVAGLALFAVSLAKLFLFDLGSLSSITRALSFLTVGMVLLVGGFFYQRLASQNGRPASGA